MLLISTVFFNLNCVFNLNCGVGVGRHTAGEGSRCAAPAGTLVGGHPRREDATGDVASPWGSQQGACQSHAVLPPYVVTGSFHPGPEGAPLDPEGALLGPEKAPSGPEMAPSGPAGAPSGPG